MKKVNVLILSAARVDENLIERVARLDTCISVKDATKPFVDELKKSGKKHPIISELEKRAERLAELYPPEQTEDLDTLLAEAEVMFGVGLFPEKLRERSPNLKWLHIAAIGVDRYKSTGLLDGSITVTNGRGAQSVPIAEHVITYMLMMAKNVALMLKNQENRRWAPIFSQELRGQTVGIIGLGSIGSEIASLSKGLGMKVLATRRSATQIEMGVLGIDALYPPAQLHEMISKCDFVVDSVPYTPETHKIIGEAELKAMKPTAYFINIGRGETVDQSVLTRALKKGWIAGAGLDVFEVEPLPVDSELWTLRNVIISDHASGNASGRDERVIQIFLENLKRYVADEKLMNIVDVIKGY